MTKGDLLCVLAEFPDDVEVHLSDSDERYFDTDRLDRPADSISWVGFREGVILLGAD